MTQEQLKNLIEKGTVSAASAAVGVALIEIPAQAAVPPEVTEVVTDATDTAGALTGVCLAVFAAGLAPWAAYTTLHWLGKIMRGSV